MTEMKKWMEEFLSLQRIAVAGATNKEEKWGYKIFKRLRDEAYQVTPIHPKLTELEGQKCYQSLGDVEGEIQGVSIVVPPSATKGVLEDCVAKKIHYVWIQPGAESEEALLYGQTQGLFLIHHTCILIALNQKEKQ